MATQLQNAEARAGVRRLVASEVTEALTGKPGLAKAAAANTAQIVAAVAAAVVGLSPAQQKRLKSKSADFAKMIAAYAEGPTERTAIKPPEKVEASKGSGFGEILNPEEGKRRLADYATHIPLEEWAGPVAGSSVLMSDLGIARSTLHDWQKRGQVISLLKGAKKHVFPLEQFMDGRPLQGIGQVLAIIGNPRRAWLWLVQESPLLRSKRPIDLLRQDRKDDVVEAARTVFDHW